MLSSHQGEPLASSTPVPVPVNDTRDDVISRTADTNPRFSSLPTQPLTTPTQSCRSPPARAKSPRTDLLASTPAAPASGANHTSNITGPSTGAYVCDFAGCTAPIFRTQYLLDSHAKVHSSARPHHCCVQGCPRAEGGAMPVPSAQIGNTNTHAQTISKGKSTAPDSSPCQHQRLLTS